MQEDYVSKAQKMIEGAQTPQDMFDAMSVLNMGMRLDYVSSRSNEVRRKLLQLGEELADIRRRLIFTAMIDEDISDESGGSQQESDIWSESFESWPNDW